MRNFHSKDFTCNVLICISTNGIQYTVCIMQYTVYKFHNNHTKGNFFNTPLNSVQYCCHLQLELSRCAIFNVFNVFTIPHMIVINEATAQIPQYILTHVGYIYNTTIHVTTYRMLPCYHLKCPYIAFMKFNQ